MKLIMGILILFGFALFVAKDVDVVRKGRQEGFEAGRSGAPSDLCPYIDPEGRGHISWMWGWNEGSEACSSSEGWERDWWIKPRKGG